MSNGHVVRVSDDNVVILAESENINLERAMFDRIGETVQFIVEIRRDRPDAVVYLSPAEAMKIAKELRRLAIAAFEAS